jgi:ribosome biogenesis GTPase
MTGEISEYHETGQHTTTFAEMHPLAFGGFLIDTPGIRGFGVIEIDKKSLSHFFPEMKAVLAHCKFSNCQHSDEPGCAVKDAVELGLIAESRYKSYLNILLEDEDSKYR